MKTKIDNANSKFFIVTGCYRSGTTALARVLNYNPDIVCLNEFQLFESGFNSYEAIEDEYKGRKHYIPVKDRFLNREAFCLEALGISKIRPQKVAELLAKHRTPTPKIVGDKLPGYVFGLNDKMERIKKVFGEYPRVIFCLRDPRAVIESQIRNYWKYRLVDNQTHKQAMVSTYVRPDLIRCLSQWPTWFDYLAAWDSFKTMYDCPYFEFKYEDFTPPSEKVLVDLSNYLSVDLEELKKSFTDLYGVQQVTHSWKEVFPQMTDFLPKYWLRLMERYGYE